MKTSRVLLLITAIILAASCSSVKSIPLNQTYEHEFLGRNAAYVQYVCGCPTKIESGVDGGQVFIYEDIEDFTLHTNIEADTSKEGCFVQMFFDKDGNCYSVRTNHVQQVKEFNKHLTWATVVSSVGGTLGLSSILGLIFSIFARR